MCNRQLVMVKEVYLKEILMKDGKFARIEKKLKDLLSKSLAIFSLKSYAKTKIITPMSQVNSARFLRTVKCSSL